MTVLECSRITREIPFLLRSGAVRASQMPVNACLNQPSPKISGRRPLPAIVIAGDVETVVGHEDLPHLARSPETL